MADVPYIESIKFLERISNGDIAWERGMLIVSPTPEKAKNLNCDIIASEFPNIGSDQQPIFSVWAALLCESVWVEDKKFRNRFSYLEQLNKFGWKSEVLNDRRKITFQPVQFDEVEFVATDLRAAFAFIVAGTFLTNKFEVTHYEQLLRGYADINQKLRFLGYEVTIIERMSHGSVAILISNENNELYLQKRDLRAPKNPGKVSLFGGAIEEGESPYEAAQRELQEELGLLSPLNYVDSFNLNQANYSISGTVHLFYLKAPRTDLTCQEGILIQRTVEQALKENLTVFARTVLETWGN
jgi:ADP-ribose pyrophosphatase YjhB (NUDIX family)